MDLNEQIKEAIERKNYLKWLNRWPNYKKVYGYDFDFGIEDMKGNDLDFENEWKIKKSLQKYKNMSGKS